MPVDFKPQLRFVRTQGGAGCWGYAGCAVWDIMNELVSPNCPNMSMNLWLMLHRRRDTWEIPGNLTPNGSHLYQTPDGCFLSMTNPEYGFFQGFGNSTEGTEPTIPIERWTGNYTEEGINEAQNYRLKSEPIKLTISSQIFRDALDSQYPIRIEITGKNWGHFVAIIGYDEVKQNFTFVDSATFADRSGFGTLSFQAVDNHKFIDGDIVEASIWEIIPPRPVPAAVIHITHKTSRMNLNLWLSVQGSPQPKRKIWPTWEWPEENRKDLNFKVRLPFGIIWPPSASNQVVLDLFDSGAVKDGGGEVIEFYAAFGAHVINCSKVLNQGPIAFNAGEHKSLIIP